MFQHENFANDFIKHFLQNGLGSMSKRDMEILVYYLLRRYGYFASNDVYEQSLKLKVSETKLRNLIYEAELKYADYDDSYVKEMILKLIENAYFKATDSGFIMFSVEDKYIHSAINARLKRLGAFSDTSFNKEIITIPKEAFILLVYDCYNDKADEILVRCRELGKTITDLDGTIIEPKDMSIKRLLYILVESAVKSFGSKAGEVAAKSLFSFLANPIQNIELINNLI